MTFAKRTARRTAPAWAFLAVSATLVCCTGRGNRLSENAGAIGDSACIVADTTFHNLGDVDYADIVALSNTLTNIGKKAVRLTSLETDCACLTARADAETIEPGEAAKVRIELDTHGSVGKQYHLVDINADNGQTIKIFVYADVSEPK